MPGLGLALVADSHMLTSRLDARLAKSMPCRHRGQRSDACLWTSVETTERGCVVVSTTGFTVGGHERTSARLILRGKPIGDEVEALGSGPSRSGRSPASANVEGSGSFIPAPHFEKTLVSVTTFGVELLVEPWSDANSDAFGEHIKGSQFECGFEVLCANRGHEPHHPVGPFCDVNHAPRLSDQVCPHRFAPVAGVCLRPVVPSTGQSVNVGDLFHIAIRAES